ncbi:MAG: IS3 family transposase [Cyclobacteriaceae bacterium]|nr:IS3 family transposase [Cyclobacteriaceae bacterium]
MLTRTIDHYREETKETLVSACGLFGVNRQVYYRSKRAFQERQQTASKVVKMVLEVRQQMPRIGTRKLYYLLQDQLNEIGVGRDKLFAILKANHMLVKPKKSYRITTDSQHWYRKHKNLIESITPVRPEQIWASDITYIGNRGNHRYLALVTDTYSKKIVGYDLSASLGADGAIRALKMGLRQRSYKEKKLIHHSDRGFQYCCDDYQKALARKKVKCSMTESYDPYANAVAERVNGILKQEFLLEDHNVKLPVLKELVRNSIEIYNKKRPHYSCDMKTPEQMHKQAQIKIRSYKKTNRTRANLDTVS